MFKHSLPSIEQFAAFLDGNLSQSEMQQFSQLAEQDSVLHQLLDASDVVDDTIAGFTDADLELPNEIIGSDFELPTIPTEGFSPLITLSPESFDGMLVAAAACAGEEASISSYENQEGLNNEAHDESSFTMPDSNGFDNSDDLSNSFSDDI